ncbi:MAG: hypothetical protein GXP25_19705 [Planctomycetes bacterium]|nr:hypothetical protein [Planctomycetota bacterium]
MRKVLLAGLVVVFACGLVFAGGGSKVVDFQGQKLPAAEAKKMEKQGYQRYYDQWFTHTSHNLKVEIDCQNLLNSLYLSEIQMRHLIGVGVKMEKTRRQLKPQVEAINKELEAALRGLKRDMLAGKDRSASPYDAKVKAAEKKMAEVRKSIRQQAVLCEAYAKAILTPNQREKCYNYEHCLIPVKSLADPTRVGSADAGTVAEKLLDKVRAMSEDEMAAAMPEIMAAHFAKMNKYLGELSKADEEKERTKIKDVFKEARAMGDLDYQVQKSRLAAQIPCDYSEIKSRLKAVNKLACKLESEKGDGKSMGVIGSMFLKPCMIPLLSQRINILQDWDNYEAIDLDKVKAAAACKNGSCAID